MKPERWQKVRQVFEAVVDMPEAEKTGYLVKAVAGKAAGAGEKDASWAQHHEFVVHAAVQAN